MFTIDIGALGTGLQTQAFEPDARDLGLDPEFFAEVGVDARLDITERRVLVYLDARALATLECDRTLQLYEQNIAGSYHLLFAPPEFIDDDDDAFDEVRPLEEGDTVIDVTAVVRDTILLAVPARCIAPGAEDEDIPTEFGVPDWKEDDIDPRWEKLKELKSGANPD